MSRSNQKAVMALLFVGVLMGALDLAIIGPALPAMQAEFNLDNRNLSWLFNVYVLAQLIGTPLFAKASDKYGRRNVYMVVVAGFGLGSLLLVMAANYETLLLGRAVQGLGASGIFPVAAAVIGGEMLKATPSCTSTTKQLPGRTISCRVTPATRPISDVSTWVISAALVRIYVNQPV